jgi:hypothetical protein
MNPKALYILEKHLDKVCWESLIDNPNCLAFVEKYHHLIPDYLRIQYSKVCAFEHIYNYKAIRESYHPFKEELIAKMFHPDNVCKWEGWGFDEFKE